ncbi:MAG: hypothetical protein N4A47_01365 [Clostridia bacterium]|jgi:hypothetical protein|nr:hypothetical protein [Clostridia bacterium]
MRYYKKFVALLAISVFFNGGVANIAESEKLIKEDISTNFFGDEYEFNAVIVGHGAVTADRDFETERNNPDKKDTIVTGEAATKIDLIETGDISK